MRTNASIRRLLLWHICPLLGLCLCTGCGTLKNGRGWGEDAIYPVQWKRIPQAAKRALFDPVTWVTAAGAAVFTIDDFDQKTSDWAVKYAPVFGTEENAREATEILVGTLEAEVLATLLLTPSGDDARQWTFSKARGLAVEWAALSATSFATNQIKNETDRERPDQSDDRSFPSSGASSAFAAARLSNRNLDSITMKPWVRTTLKTGNIVLASAAAWARVEGQKHYPSDVLAGACLGNFVTAFIHDAFMNLPEDTDFSFYLEPSPHGFYASVSWDF
jgi:membrane-associated phospholipid phosphatase